MAGAHTDLVGACLRLLRLRGVVAWKNNTGAARIGGRFVRFGEPGLPDVLAVLPPAGRLLGVECKTGSGRLSPAQRAARDALAAAGALVVTVRDVGELDALLATLLEGVQ